MTASEPTIHVPTVIDPADIQLPRTQPIDVTEILRAQLNE
ncbi:hypothetical protein BH09ACT6_BH09ACT6_15000 [soil metagenome]